jgi:Ion channel
MRRRFSAIELLISLAVLFVSFPFIEELASGTIILTILITIVLVSAVFAVAGRGRIAMIATSLAIPTVAGRWLSHYRPDLVPPEVFLIGGIVFVLFVTAHLLRFVLNAPSVTVDVLCASISAYLLLGLLWTFAYWLIAELVPNAFALNAAPGTDISMKGFNAFYFSFVTLATVGYGDVVPVSKVARMLAAAEAVIGLFYMAILIARLVAIRATAVTHQD